MGSEPVEAAAMTTECEGGALPAGVDRSVFGTTVREMKRRTLSDRALELVNGPRQDSYGEPVDHCAKVAGVWRAMFGWDVDAHKFSLAMTALKLVREANQPKQDSRTDAVGWLEIADRIVTENESAPRAE